MDDLTIRALATYGVLIGIVFVIVLTSTIRTRKKRLAIVREYISMDFPGKVFQELLDLYNLFAVVKRESVRKARTKQLMEQFNALSKNVAKYLDKVHDTSVIMSKPVRSVTSNLAVCLSSLLKKISDEKTLTRLDGDFSRATVHLMDSVNRLNQYSLADEYCMREIMTALKRIYFSLYTRNDFDPTVTKELWSDFVNGAKAAMGSKIELEKYLTVLKVKWGSNMMLRKVDRDLIMPTVTARNVLALCLKEYEDVNLTQMREDLLRKISEQKFDEVCYTGLLFDKKKVIRDTYQEINDSLSGREVFVAA